MNPPLLCWAFSRKLLVDCLQLALYLSFVNRVLHKWRGSSAATRGGGCPFSAPRTPVRRFSGFKLGATPSRRVDCRDHEISSMDEKLPSTSDTPQGTKSFSSQSKAELVCRQCLSDYPTYQVVSSSLPEGHAALSGLEAPHRGSSLSRSRES